MYITILSSPSCCIAISHILGYRKFLSITSINAPCLFWWKSYFLRLMHVAWQLYFVNTPTIPKTYWGTRLIKCCFMRETEIIEPSYCKLIAWAVGRFELVFAQIFYPSKQAPIAARALLPTNNLEDSSDLHCSVEICRVEKIMSLIMWICSLLDVFIGLSWVKWVLLGKQSAP